MDIRISDDKKFLILRNLNDFESESVREWFTKEPENSWILKKNSPWIETRREFINKVGMMPIGLWLDLMKYGKAKNVGLLFEPSINDIIQDAKLKFEDFKSYVDELFANAYLDNGEKAKARSYQLEGVFRLLKFRKACIEVTTSGGKTLMAYILFKYLREVKQKKKCLYIVPNKNLATQSWEKFENYEKWVRGKNDYKSSYLVGDMSKKEKDLVPEADIVFATYQSLNKVKENEFFDKFDVVMVDECHHSVSKSIRQILSRCHNKEYVFGMTGTFPKENSFDRFVIESFIGPLVYTLTAFELINVHKSATPIYIINTYLDYASEEEKKALYEARKMKNKDDTSAGAKLLKQEMAFVNNNYNRMKYICDIAQKTSKNTLILFNDVKNSEGYGRKIFNYLKKYSDKTVFYADGNTDTKVRDYYNQRMDEDTSQQTVIVGSQGTYSEGIDIANIGVIILAESFKSEYILRQSIGRGMRLGDKDEVVMFDIVDDLRYGPQGEKEWIKNNYIWKQHLDRTNAYKKHQFPVFEQKVDFKTNQVTEL